MDRKFTIPHLWLSIDSSGSMKDPRYMSEAVLGGFVLANNYHANGSKVGAMNFSADSLFLFPTRDLMDVYKVLCAYWGGGTVYDITKLKEYLKTAAYQEWFRQSGIKGIQLSTDKDYERLIHQLEPERQKEFQKKQLSVKLDAKTQQLYEKLDHVMLTDGGIYNLDKVIDYFNGTAQYTRHTIIVVNNARFVSEARAMGLKNTNIIPVDSDKDISSIIIGQAKNMAKSDQVGVRYR